MSKVLKIFLAFIFCSSSVFAYEKDNLVETTLINKELIQPEYNLNFNYQSTTKIPINMHLIKPIKSEKDLYEGQILEFRVKENVKYENKLIVKAGDNVKARVETIIDNGMNGIPAGIIIGNFEIKGIKHSQITTNIEKYGIDLSLLVYPIKWILTPLPPTGSLTNFIKGGHVRINTNDIITVYYYPKLL